MITHSVSVHSNWSFVKDTTSTVLLLLRLFFSDFYLPPPPPPISFPTRSSSTSFLPCTQRLLCCTFSVLVQLLHTFLEPLLSDRQDLFLQPEFFYQSFRVHFGFLCYYFLPFLLTHFLSNSPFSRTRDGLAYCPRLASRLALLVRPVRTTGFSIFTRFDVRGRGRLDRFQQTPQLLPRDPP